jgi:hypothetical protein
MIQRAQSIYLLLVTVLMSFLLVRPYAAITLSDGQELMFHTHAVKEIGYTAITTLKLTLPVIVLAITAGLISFGNIFLFSRRLLQMKICAINVLIMLVLEITMFLYYILLKHPIGELRHTFKVSAIYPVLGIILTIMAFRAINHDEMLVNSYKRIR